MNDDPEGHAIFDQFNNKNALLIVERDDGYIEASPDPPYQLLTFDKRREYVKKVMKQVEGDVLCIGCGAGTYSIYLQKKGFKVLSIESSKLSIKVCKARGAKNVKLIRELRECVSFKTKFNTILALDNRFGLFRSKKGAKALFKMFYKLTYPDSMIIVESFNPYKTKDKFHLDYHKFNTDRGRMGGQIRMKLRYQRYTSKWFDYLFVSPEEMRDIVSDTGWKIRNTVKSKGPHCVYIMCKSK
jgi:cyclopropane fatty-acyl-phospholipid synthase-like methyltransferase